MNNQEQFLRTVRLALGEGPDGVRSKKLFPNLFRGPDRNKLIAQIRKRSQTELLRLAEGFKANGKELHQSTHLVPSMEEAAAIIVELVRSKTPEFGHTRHIIQHDHDDIAALELWKRFTRESVTVHTTFSSDPQLRDKTIASYIGITAHDIGVADSATLLQVTSPGCPRSTSLVPSIHVALLRLENLVATLEEAYALLQERPLPDSFTFISGPSKTADIEAHLVHGAHGPCEVHVIILSPSVLTPLPVKEPTETAPADAAETQEKSENS